MHDRGTWPYSARFGGLSQTRTDIRQQLAAVRPAIVGGFLVAALLLGTVLIFRLWPGISFAAFMRDPSAYVGAPAYIGAISHIGVMMWGAAAAICLFAAWALWRDGGDREKVRFLAWSGLGTFYLGLDDAMLLHEVIIFRLTGLSEQVILGAYIVAFAVYLGRFHRALLQAEYVLLLIALCFAGLSVVQDALLPLSDIQVFFEDAAKLVGIIFWLIFYVRTGAAAVTHRMMAASGGRGRVG